MRRVRISPSGTYNLSRKYNRPSFYRAFRQGNFFGVRDAVRFEHLVSDFHAPLVTLVTFVEESSNLVVDGFWLDFVENSGEERNFLLPGEIGKEFRELGVELHLFLYGRIDVVRLKQRLLLVLDTVIIYVF